MLLFNQRSEQLRFQIRRCQEQVNILSDANLKLSLSNSSLEEKICRYNNLKNIIEKLNQELGLDYIIDTLVDILFSLIGRNKGACLLYLVDQSRQKLNLLGSRKENEGSVIKDKEGDLFDSWVVKHTSPLLVQDGRKDFRFDPQKLKSGDKRQVGSLISAPLISENKFLGILRLDSQLPGAYSQEDLRLLAVISDIAAIAIENSEFFERTRDLAIHDGLTGLFTKNYFLERLNQECLASRRQKTPLSLLMLDVDLFKNYNDKFGHASGDIVLRRLSALIKEFLVSQNYLACRFGGEEFCVLLMDKGLQQALDIAELLRKTIEMSKINFRRQEAKVTVSIGAAVFSAGMSEPEELIRKADQAMYAAKEAGRNQVKC